MVSGAIKETDALVKADVSGEATRVERGRHQNAPERMTGTESTGLGWREVIRGQARGLEEQCEPQLGWLRQVQENLVVWGRGLHIHMWMWMS